MKTVKSVHFNVQKKSQSVGCTKDFKSVRLATVLKILITAVLQLLQESNIQDIKPLMIESLKWHKPVNHKDSNQLIIVKDLNQVN